MIREKSRYLENQGTDAEVNGPSVRVHVFPLLIDFLFNWRYFAFNFIFQYHFLIQRSYFRSEIKRWSHEPVYKHNKQKQTGNNKNSNLRGRKPKRTNKQDDPLIA